MNDLGHLVCENLLGAVDRIPLDSNKTTNLIHREICEQRETGLDIGIIDIAPILVKVIGRRFFSIEP